MEWINVKDKVPDEFQAVYVRTSCIACPVLSALYVKGEFVLSALMQCDRHMLEEPSFKYVGYADELSIFAFTSRITHWFPRCA